MEIMIVQTKMVNDYQTIHIAWNITANARREVSCKHNQFNTWPNACVYTNRPITDTNKNAII